MSKIKFLLLLFFLPFLFTLKDRPPKYYLSACAIFRNEARFLKEWIEYHKIIGVQHFYLFNHLSEDHYREVLKSYVDQGIVELFEWPYEAKNHKEWNKIQCNAYNTLLAQKGKETFWLAVIDTDEFIFPVNTTNLAEFLQQYETYGGLGINWQLYGTSNVPRIFPEQTLIGTLTKKAPKEFISNKFVKTIFQPKKVKKMKQPHHCKYKKPYYHVNEKKEVFPQKSLTNFVSVDLIRINHYTYRDEEFFYSEKQRRIKNWFPNGNLPQINPEYNAIEDTTVFSLLPELEKRLCGN